MPTFMVTYYPGTASCQKHPHINCDHREKTTTIIARNWEEANKISAAKFGHTSDGCLVLEVTAPQQVRTVEELLNILIKCPTRMRVFGWARDAIDDDDLNTLTVNFQCQKNRVVLG